MAPVDDIQTFLDNKAEYSYGVHLLSLSIRNTRLVQTLMRKENDLNWQKLIYELEKVVKNNPLNPIENGQEKETAQTKIYSQSKRNEPSSRPEIYTQQIENRTQKELSSLPSSDSNSGVANSISTIYSQVKEKRIKLYRSRGHLHGRLHETSSNSDRKELAGEIISIQSDIEAINKDMRLIEEGNIPRELVLKMMSADQYRNYRNYQNYVVRYRNYLKKEDLTDEKRSNYESKLKEYETKIENFFAYA